MIKTLHLKTKILKFSLGSIATLVGILMFLSAPAKGQIVNGGFEDAPNGTVPFATSTLANWNPANSDASPTPLTQVIGENPTAYGFTAHGGVISAVFTSQANATAGAMATLSQSFTTTVGQTYNIQLFVANPSNDPTSTLNLFQVAWNGNAVDLTNPTIVTMGSGNFSVASLSNPTQLGGVPGTYVVAPNTGWFEVDIAVTAPTASSSITIAAQNNSSLATFVDDVSITPTPEPSAVVLLVAGAGLIGLGRRRQQRAA
jgi:hypothetical protein